MTSMTSSLFFPVSKTAENSLYLNRCCFFVLSFYWFIQSYSNLTKTFSTSIPLEQYSWIKNNRRFPCSDDVINLVLAFWQIWSHFWAIFQKVCFFNTVYEKVCYRWKLSTKKKIICDTWSINMRIWANELIVLLIFRILRHNDIITISYWKYEFRFEIRVSNLVCVLNFNS